MLDDENIHEEEEQDYCDLDPNKLCDNCYKCIESEGSGKVYKTIYARLMLDGQSRNTPQFEYVSVSQAEEEGLISIENLLGEREEEAEKKESVPPEQESEDEFGFGANVEPIDIDPELLKEWEMKLAALEEEERGQEQEDDDDDEL